jgi:short-subunit dehydrogenase
MLKLRGSTALVTGASKGLGAAFAHALAARGVNLVLVARSQESLEALAKELEYEYPIKAVALTADLAQAGEAQRIVRELEQRIIQVDLLINNAGYGLSGSFVNNVHEDELGQVALNVQALMSLTHFFGKQMSQRGQGGIINVASNASFQPVPYQATYAATKAFVLSFTEAIAYELGERGVQVMASCPGPTATSFFDTMPTSMQIGQMDSSESVAVNTLNAFERGERVAYPGRASVRLMAVVAQLFPRAAVLKLAAAASKKMGLHVGRTV